MAVVRVGQVGLGNLGFLMARSVVAKGFPFLVCDLRREPIREMVKLGAKAVGTPREVAANSDIMISIVNDISDNETIIFGEDGLMAGAKKESVIMVCSTVGPDYVKTVYNRAKDKGIRIVDVGMSKDGPGEEVGSQTMMCGGEETDFNYCRPVLDAIAKHVFYVGPIGSGQAFKVINNLMGIAIGTVTREALNVGVKAGLDLEKMVEVMKVGTGGSWSLNYMDFQMKAKKGIETSVSRPSPTKNIGLKDWTLARDFAKAVGAEIPATEYIHNLNTQGLYQDLAKAQSQIRK